MGSSRMCKLCSVIKNVYENLIGIIVIFMHFIWMRIAMKYCRITGMKGRFFKHMPHEILHNVMPHHWWVSLNYANCHIAGNITPFVEWQQILELRILFLFHANFFHIEKWDDINFIKMTKYCETTACPMEFLHFPLALIFITFPAQ